MNNVLTSESLLTVNRLGVAYEGESRQVVEDVSFCVEKGSTVGIVGESGSGKTTIGRALLQLLPSKSRISGEAWFDGKNLLALSPSEFRHLRRRMQMIFQDPFQSLNPRLRVESIVAEPLQIHCPDMSKADRHRRILDLFAQVDLPATSLRRFPHEFSGGQRQRIGIARALATSPELLICDEPVSALDVSVQAQILNLLQDLQKQLGLTYLFIGHDLAVIQHISDRIVVMHKGRLVEDSPVEALYKNPQDPYTQKLIQIASC